MMRTPDPSIELVDVLRSEYAALGRTAAPEDRAGTDGVDDKQAPRDEKLRRYYEYLAGEPPLSALCLSGGGIRSASYCLGVLQALARQGLLDRFDYLSSVSGGGYIAGWLQRWRRDRGAAAPIGAALAAGEAVPRIEALRAMSSYLSPRLGATSPDLWAGIVLWLRNMAMNWLVLMPLLLACLQLPWIFADLVKIVVDLPVVPCRAAQALLAVAALLALAAGLLEAAWYRRYAPRDIASAAGTRTILVRVLLPILVGVVCLACEGATERGVAHPVLGGLGGLVLYLLAELGAVRRSAGMVPDAPGAKWRTLRRMLAPTMPRLSDPVPIWLETALWTVSGAVAGTLYGLLSARIAGSAAWAGLGVCACLQLLMLPNFLFTGLGSYSDHGDIDREWLARAATLFLGASVLWGGLCLATLWLGPMRFVAIDRFYVALTAGASTGLAAALAGASRQTAATLARRVAAGPIPLGWVLQAVSIVFIATLLIGFGRLEPTLLDRANESGRRHAGLWLLEDTGALLALLAVAALVSVAVNINRFSLHGVYRNRLIRSFLGAARSVRRPSRFTGFDPDDNLPMKDLWPGGTRGLFPVINVTLNLVSDKNLSLQERKAEAFTITPLHCGAASTGYRQTGQYGGMRDGITLGTAITISGAAASPNMGYHSSPLVGAIMTLFNVRLGAWLGNPNGDAMVARGDGPRYAAFALLRELFGITNDKDGYIYLSDGGHFENLGIYEMLRRRCRFIVVVDAGADPKAEFADLGGLVRKARLDFGTEIAFGRLSIAARANPAKSGVDVALGTVTYPEGGEPAWLIYLKPGFHGTEPVDVTAFAATHPSFPHETTANQFFLESRMESYRALGEAAIGRLVQAGPGVGTQPGSGTLDWLLACTREHLRRTP